MKVERESALEHKKRMSRMMEDKENFLSKITAARSFIYKVTSVPLTYARSRTMVSEIILVCGGSVHV